MTSRLPRGPHSLSPADVAASQRARIIAALTAIAAEVGVESTRVVDVCQRAGVSNSAFYAQFANKGEAFLAAYDEMADHVNTAALAAFAPGRPWRETVATAVTNYLQALADAPDSAKLFLVESAAAPREVRERRRERHQEFAALIQALHEHARSQDPRLASATPGLYLAVISGITGRVAESLTAIDTEAFATLHTDLYRFVVALILGLEE